MTPYITIITPLFNEEKNLPAFIEQIKCQRYKNFQVTAVEGGSTDHTINIIINHANERWYNCFTQFTGIYEKMNIGIANAKSEWLYFMGADDCFYSDRTLLIAAMLLERSHADIVYGDIYSEKLGYYDGHFNIKKILTRNVPHQAVFYRRRVFERVGLYNPKYKFCADYEFNLRCWLGGMKTEYVQLVVANYGDQGVSSKNVDRAFHRDFHKIVLRHVNWRKFYAVPILIWKLIYRKLKNRKS